MSISQQEREQFFEDTGPASPRGLVGRMSYIQHHREQAKGKGPEARVSRMIVDQMAGRSPRPL